MNLHEPITQLQSFATLDNTCFTHSLHLLLSPHLFWNICKIIIYHVIDIYRYSLSSYYVPGSVPGTGDAAVKNQSTELVK